MKNLKGPLTTTHVPAIQVDARLTAREVDYVLGWANVVANEGFEMDEHERELLDRLHDLAKKMRSEDEDG